MPTIINQKAEVTSKGVKYTFYHGVSESGEGVTLILNAQQVSEFGEILDKACADKEVLMDMFKGRETVDVQFNQRGRLVSVQ